MEIFGVSWVTEARTKSYVPTVQTKVEATFVIVGGVNANKKFGGGGGGLVEPVTDADCVE